MDISELVDNFWTPSARLFMSFYLWLKMFDTFMKQKSGIFYLGHPISSAFFYAVGRHIINSDACSSTHRCLEAVYLVGWQVLTIKKGHIFQCKAMSVCSSWCYRPLLACQCAFIRPPTLHHYCPMTWHLEDGKQSITYGFWLMTNRPFSAAKGHRGAKLSLHSSSLPLLLSSIYVHEVVRDGLGAQLASENRTATSSSKQ